MGAFLSFIAFVMGAICAALFGSALSLFYGWNIYLAMAVVFLAVNVATAALLGAVGGILMMAGGGIWSASSMRWLVGKFAQGVLLVGALLVIDFLLRPFRLHAAIHNLISIDTLERLSPGAVWAFLMSLSIWGWIGLWLAFAVFGAAVSIMMDWERWVLAVATLPVRRMWRALKAGVGGSESFIGLLDEWLMPYKPGRVMLGTSLYEPGRKIGRRDDRHMLTIATTRAGKGRSAIIPNLLLWPGSAIVIDPKGENAAVTARARGKMGQQVFILDPFRVLEGLGLAERDFPVHRFNPLDSIDLGDLDVVEQIGNLADALIITSEHSNPFWDNAAKAVLVGIIAHVVSWPGIKPEERHLGTVRDYVANVRGRDLRRDAGKHPSPGNLAEIAVATLGQSSDDAGGDILTTLSVHVKWLDSLAMREALTASDFRLVDLKGSNATLYMILPPKYLKEHARFLRLFVTLALQAAGGVKAKYPMLFVLDEFAHLGPLKSVEEAASLMAGSGVKLWPFIQSLTQLRMYGDNWEVFLSQAGTIQVFAMNDQTTADYFSKRLGHHISWRRVRVGLNPRTKQPEYEWTPQSATFLRTGPELARESSRDSGRALLFFEGGTAGLVRRANYDRLFDPDKYGANPYEKARGVRGQWGQFWRGLNELSDMNGFEFWARVGGMLRGNSFYHDKEEEEQRAERRALRAQQFISVPAEDDQAMPAPVAAVDLPVADVPEEAPAQQETLPQAQALLDVESEIAREVEGQGVRPAEVIETPAVKKTPARKPAQKKTGAKRAPKKPKV
jgi:type IV secretory pathway TraG/TraD family ATPase VirD4